MTWYEILVLVAGALGGFDLVKWLANVIGNRKNNSRIADAEADAAEFHILQEQIQFLQQQLKDKEERFAEQTELLRKVQRERLDVEKEKSIMEIGYLKRIAALELELALKKCDDEECPFRKPPTAKTPPKTGLTKQSYFKNRDKTKSVSDDTTESPSAQV